MLPKFGHMYRLTRDPETNFTGGGLQITKVGLACSEKYKEKETQLFIDAVAFGKTAEMFAGVKQGHRVFAYIKLQTEKWQDKNTGQNRYKISGIIESFEFIEPKDKGQGNQGYQPQQQQGYQNAGGGGYQQPQSNQQGNFVGSPPDGSDVPF